MAIRMKFEGFIFVAEKIRVFLKSFGRYEIFGAFLCLIG